MVERAGVHCCRLCGKPGKFVKYLGRRYQIVWLECRTCTHAFVSCLTGKQGRTPATWSAPRKEVP